MNNIVEIPAIAIDRARLMQLARFFSKYEGTCLLYSGSTANSCLANRRSFLCLFPYETLRPEPQEQCNPWESLKSRLTMPDNPHPFPEWVGFLGYGMGAYIEDLPSLKMQESCLPNFFFQRYAVVLEVDHQSQSVRMMAAEASRSLLGPIELQWVDSLADPRFWPGFFRRLAGPGIDSTPGGNNFELIFQEPLSRYCEKVLQAQEWIRSGDVYQLNLSQKFTFRGSGDGFRIFEELANANPAPFSVFLQSEAFTIISSSPESFMRKRQNVLETRPIKGTAPRGKTAAEDEVNRAKLLSSEKERAELLMIVDLMRNDLGKCSLTGSVETKEIWGCEAYTNVFHLVATIRSLVRSELHSVDLIRACFPGGSITGCPKLKAMECIAQLEQRARGIYTGSIGYFSGDGDFDFNIAIRTLVMHEDLIEVQVGGAIVIDSDPIKEYEETLHKGATIFKVLGVEAEV